MIRYLLNPNERGNPRAYGLRGVNAISYRVVDVGELRAEILLMFTPPRA
jgi:hypothetical protein